MNKKTKILIIFIVIAVIIIGVISYGVSIYVQNAERKAIEETKIAMQKEQAEKAKQEKKKEEEVKKQQEIEKQKQLEAEQARQQESQENQEEESQLVQDEEEKRVIGEEIREQINNGYFPSDEEFKSFILNSFANYMRNKELQFAQIAKANNKTITDRSFDDLANQFFQEIKSTEYYKARNVKQIMGYILEQTPNFILNNFLVDKY